MPNKKYPNDNLYYRERSEKSILPVSHIIVPYWKLNFVKKPAAYELSEKLFGYALREFIKDCKIINNTSADEGGGIFINGSSPTLYNLEILNSKVISKQYTREKRPFNRSSEQQEKNINPRFECKKNNEKKHSDQDSELKLAIDILKDKSLYRRLIGHSTMINFQRN